MSQFEVLSVESLRVEVPFRESMRQVVKDVGFSIGHSESVAIVGESGAGKSMTARAVTRLLPSGSRVSGKVFFEGSDVLQFTGAELRGYRSRSIGIVHQDPRVHINPVHTVGDFLVEGLRYLQGFSRGAAERRAVELLNEVGIHQPQVRVRQYPHELSGGMLQRVMIAAAIASGPKLLVADEPTTALDVTTQARIMALLDRLRQDHGLALLFITHDLELAAAACDRTLVMYAGSIVEEQGSRSLHRPLHPYTSGLLSARPRVDARLPRLHAIPGQSIASFESGPGCAFAPRCEFAIDRCRSSWPELIHKPLGRVRCIRSDELYAIGLRERPTDG